MSLKFAMIFLGSNTVKTLFVLYTLVPSACFPFAIFEVTQSESVKGTVSVIFGSLVEFETNLAKAEDLVES